jgi:hypothetical protein
MSLILLRISLKATQLREDVIDGLLSPVMFAVFLIYQNGISEEYLRYLAIKLEIVCKMFYQGRININ